MSATLMIVVTGCSLGGRPARRFVDDATISGRVRQRLAGVSSSLALVEVDTFEATVYLNGPVDTAATKRVAEELARDVDDVELVVSNLHVPRAAASALPADCPPSPADALPAAIVPDSPYTARQ
jgi:hypothetical protein